MKAVLYFPLAIIVASLTETQSTVVMGCLIFVVFLLVIGVYRTFKRLDELEEVVYKSKEKTSNLNELVTSVKEE